MLWGGGGDEALEFVEAGRYERAPCSGSRKFWARPFRKSSSVNFSRLPQSAAAAAVDGPRKEELAGVGARATPLLDSLKKRDAGLREQADAPEHVNQEVLSRDGSLSIVSAVGDWDFAESENKVIAEQDFRSDLEVKAGDFLVTRANADPSSVGRTCIVASTRNNLMLSDKTWRLRFHEDHPYDQHAVLAWTKSRAFRGHIRNQLNGTDAKNISQARFLTGPIPKLDDTFNAFSRHVSELSESLKSLQSRAKQARDLERSLLSDVMGR